MHTFVAKIKFEQMYKVIDRGKMEWLQSVELVVEMVQKPFLLIS
jgi:hypothetical protein